MQCMRIMQRSAVAPDISYAEIGVIAVLTACGIIAGTFLSYIGKFTKLCMHM